MKTVLTFDAMLTPKLITFLYWIELICVVLGSVTMIVSGSILAGLLVLPFGVLWVRVFNELLIVVFKMNEALQEIRNK